MGIDPGLRFTGWGVIEAEGNRLRHIADGVVATDNSDAVPARLKFIHDALTDLFLQYSPSEAAVEETYVNRNGAATLKLGYARGVALLAPALAGISVAEYGAMEVKRAVVGTGCGDKGSGRGDGPPTASRRDPEAGRCRRRSRRRHLSCPPPADPAPYCRGHGDGVIALLSGRVDGSRGGSLHYRRRRRRLLGAGLDTNPGGVADAAGGRAGAGRDASARRCDHALRFRGVRGTRLVSAVADRARRRRQGGAQHPVGDGAQRTDRRHCRQ